jgi:hypothetical protein
MHALPRDLPERADEDVVARVIHLTLGGDAKILRVLTIAENREWTAGFSLSVKDKLKDAGPLDSLDKAEVLLNQSIDTMLDLLLAYDVDTSLGDKAWIDEHATDREVYEGIKQVVAAAYPFGLDLRVLAPELIPMIASGISRGIAAATVAMASSQFMNIRRQLTDGPRKRSKKSSPTNSSSASTKG